MAKDLKQATEPALNSDARAAAIRDGFAAIYGVDGNIESVRAEHMTPLTELQTKKWRTLKKDLNIPRKVLELQYKQYKLAREAMADEDENNTIENMRETFLALHPGGQVDWIAALSA